LIGAREITTNARAYGGSSDKEISNFKSVPRDFSFKVI
jgi:hypothetical protein